MFQREQLEHMTVRTELQLLPGDRYIVFLANL